MEHHGTATTDQFSILHGPEQQRCYVMCNLCLVEADLEATEPYQVTAEAALLKREHDPVTCGENRDRHKLAKRWTKDDGAKSHHLDPAEGAG